MPRACAGLTLWVLVVGAAPAARAQPAFIQSALDTLRGRLAVQVNAAARPGAAEWTQSLTARAFGETLRFDAVHERRTGAVVDAGGSLRVWRRLSVGAAYTHLRKSGDARLTGAVPHPIRFGQDRAFDYRTGALAHRERATHIHVAWRVPLRPVAGLDVAVHGGPSFFNLTRGAVHGVRIEETGPPFSTVRVAGTVDAEHTRNGWGGHVGVDVSYMLTSVFGVGGIVRFSRGSVTLPPLAGTDTVTAGGLQTGGGLRVRF